MPQTVIKNIIFDIGNVLSDFRWRDCLKDKGFDDDMVERIGRASVDSPLWREFDRGEWSEEKLMRAFIANDPEIEKELHLAFDDIRGMVTLRDYAVSWVRGFKERGYKVWYLSNFALKAERQCSDSLAFLPDMDGGILSYREHMVKPDPEIYRLLLNRYALKAVECVFIDDTAVNVEEAKRQGIHGIVFHSREQAEEELRALGVRI